MNSVGFPKEALLLRLPLQKTQLEAKPSLNLEKMREREQVSFLQTFPKLSRSIIRSGKLPNFPQFSMRKKQLFPPNGLFQRSWQQKGNKLPFLLLYKAGNISIQWAERNIAGMQIYWIRCDVTPTSHFTCLLVPSSHLPLTATVLDSSLGIIGNSFLGVLAHYWMC